MRRSLILLYFLVGIWGCRSASSVTPDTLSLVHPDACTGFKEPRGAAFVDFETFVVAKTYTSDQGDTHTLYFLDKPEADVPKLYYYACNLPEVYKHANLRVRINGYRFIPDPGTDYVGLPVELTSIEVAELR